jgi:hypothetical protein
MATSSNGYVGATKGWAKPAPQTRFIEGLGEGAGLGFELRDFFLQIVDPTFVTFDRHLDSLLDFTPIP